MDYVKISKKMREDAILICAVCSSNGTEFYDNHDDAAVVLGLSTRFVFDGKCGSGAQLAFMAWQEVHLDQNGGCEGASSGHSRDGLCDAAAELLLRSGWTPDENAAAELLLRSVWSPA